MWDINFQMCPIKTARPLLQGSLYHQLSCLGSVHIIIVVIIIMPVIIMVIIIMSVSNNLGGDHLSILTQAGLMPLIACTMCLVARGCKAFEWSDLGHVLGQSVLSQSGSESSLDYNHLIKACICRQASKGLIVHTPTGWLHKGSSGKVEATRVAISSSGHIVLMSSTIKSSIWSSFQSVVG